MKYFYQASGNSIRIIEPETGFIFGHVADAPGGKYRVTTPGAKLLALVDTVDGAPPVLVDYHEKHPTKWARDSLRKYSRDTPFGLLRVEQNASGAWSMYRDCRECVATLRSGDKRAALRTVKGAQAITDALHARQSGQGRGRLALGCDVGAPSVNPPMKRLPGVVTQGTPSGLRPGRNRRHLRVNLRGRQTRV